jgi:hypothetical protein
MERIANPSTTCRVGVSLNAALQEGSRSRLREGSD